MRERPRSTVLIWAPSRVSTPDPYAQPVLHTARLLLVPLADRHLDLEVELDSEAEVMRYLSGLPNP